MSDKRKTLGELVSQARLGTIPRSSLRFIAERSAISLNYLWHIEHDLAVPSRDVILRLSRSLGLEPVNLLAVSGRFSDLSLSFMRSHPSIMTLVEMLASQNASDEEIRDLMPQPRRCV